MRKIINRVNGFIFGGVLGALAAVLLYFFSDKEAVRRFKVGYHEAWEAARVAGQKRRTELETELKKTSALSRRVRGEKPEEQDQ